MHYLAIRYSECRAAVRGTATDGGGGCRNQRLHATLRFSSPTVSDRISVLARTDLIQSLQNATPGTVKPHRHTQAATGLVLVQPRPGCSPRVYIALSPAAGS
jgi:gentisate 1,2-dioxygenase